MDSVLYPVMDTHFAVLPLGKCEFTCSRDSNNWLSALGVIDVVVAQLEAPCLPRFLRLPHPRTGTSRRSLEPPSRTSHPRHCVALLDS